ncbi:leucine-rich melanocyte differentiation-associated protein-like isoform X1 [Ostrinia furnacalis]|uniref:leucine-rich melanocyte differentiation-associated protein-like isoform X1 n=1 Tax=Ostrinia furnacalis TaxID=93504 RepID=UPI00103E048C|nr:leucine-rich melanocyte differentiation-associated protein-like isoform X1 [Ostrinia furnacalis]
MPSPGNLCRMISSHLGTVLNIGIVILTFFESYMFPLAIIKWMIIVTKYSGVPLLEKCASLQHKSVRTRYQYNLQLVTCMSRRGNDMVQNCVSNVSVTVEEDSSADGQKRMQLSYCGQDCKRIPPALQKMYGAKVKYLDLSYNSIETLKGLEQFGRLEELILDNNKLGDGVTFPYLPYLRTLSLNNNQITDLEALITKITDRLPSLSYLSILSNKACPNELSDLDKDDSDYQRYRYFVLYKLKNLRFLDSRRVSSQERSVADTRGEFMRVRRPPAEELAPSAPRGQPLRPLPVDFSALGKHKGAYGKCHYKYTGKHSEGNRFILNSDL